MKEIFINNYISKRKERIKDDEQRWEHIVLTDEEVEERLKKEDVYDKMYVFLFHSRYVRDKMFDRDGFKFHGFIRYLKEYDCNCDYSFEFLDYIYDNLYEKLDIYEDLIRIADRYRGKTREKCHFYDSDDSLNQYDWLLPKDFYDDWKEFEISKYIDDFIDKHNFKNNHDIRFWWFVVTYNYFAHIGIDIRKM